MSDNDGRRDFDFLFGRWRVANSRLKKRLAGNDEWQEFPAVNACQPVIGGLGNVDTFDVEKFPTDGKPLHGLTLRVFDPATRLWSIFWVDDRSTALQPPVIGRWDGPRGTFSGDDTFDGKPIRVRYLWGNQGGGRATWEQAFSTDGEKTWETNWRMVLTREG